MFRRHELWALLLFVGAQVWAQLTTSGEFVAKLSVLPETGLEKAALTLTIGFGNWKISSTSEFGPIGFTNQQFSLLGNIGPFKIDGGMAFNPSSSEIISINFPEHCDPQSASVTLTPPAYKWSWFELAFTLADFTLSGRMEHWAYPYIPSWAEEYYDTYTWPCCQPEQTPSSYMFFLFLAKASPFFLKMRFADCCFGITFSDLLLGFEDMSLCCGTTLDLTFYFTKAGFQYATFVIENVPFICCGFALDFAIKFTISGKEVSIRPKWVGIGNLCVQVYGDVHMDGASITGIEVYGYKIRCELEPCHFVEYMTVLSLDVVDEVEKIVGDVFIDDELEFIKFGFCGQGCCGSTYVLDATVFFQTGVSLFGFSRVVVNMEVPLLTNFSFTSSFTLPAAGTPSMNMGFVFTF